MLVNAYLCYLARANLPLLHRIHRGREKRVFYYSLRNFVAFQERMSGFYCCSEDVYIQL
jgi:hypothetical protein